MTDTENKKHYITVKDSIKFKGKFDNNFLSIISSFDNNDIDSALSYLKKFLSNINRCEYEYIVTNLIKLSILDNDDAYTLPKVELLLMNNDNYKFNISNYIKKFYLCLLNKKMEEAKIYLDIINNAKKITNASINTDELCKLLNYYQTSDKNSKSYNHVRDIVYYKLERLEENDIDIDEDDIEEKENNVKTAEILRAENDIKFIEKKHSELIKNKGIIILKPTSKDRTDFILDEADKYIDMSVFPIVDDGEIRVVLKYNDIYYEDFNIKSLIDEAMDDYKNGRYDESLKKQLKILETTPGKKSTNYAMIGLSYYRLFKKDKAIDYLTIANHLAKQENNPKDYGDFLLKIKGQIAEEDSKVFVKMKQSDFRNDNVKFYGIKNFDKLNDYICNSGLDVETACRKINMSDEAIDVVKLIYAREYYTLGNNKMGELFFRSYEKSEHKTKKTKSIYKYIQQSKKFYKIRFKGTPRQLSLKLIPHK